MYILTIAFCTTFTHDLETEVHVMVYMTFITLLVFVLLR